MENSTTQMTYLQAIQTTIAKKMKKNPQIILIGQDINTYGGAFKVTDSLTKQIEASRLIDSPISETGMIGTAVGAAIVGFRPIVEIQFADFLSCAFNQITNLLAKFYFRNSQALPILIRTPAGGGLGFGPFHSQNPESYYIHTPGIKIVCPSTVKDAILLLDAAMHDEGPVIFIEYKKLYRTLKEEVHFPANNNETYKEDVIGKARIRCIGSDITLVAFGPLCNDSVEVARHLYVNEKISLEVIDLRSLVPLDITTIVNSVKKTGKVIIVHESSLIGGIGGEICAKLNESVFEFLDGPILRIGAKNCPVPYNSQMEKVILPSAPEIYKAAKWLARY